MLVAQGKATGDIIRILAQQHAEVAFLDLDLTLQRGDQGLGTGQLHLGLVVSRLGSKSALIAKLRQAAQTDLFPKIRLTSNYGFESDELSSILKSPAGFIAGSLLQPIFAMGKNKAKVKAAKARYEQEVYSYEKSVLGAFKEVNNAIVTVRKVKEIRASRMNLEASASKYLELAQLQYINGVISYMDVLDAQRGLLDAQIGLNNAVLDELLSVVYLYKALGGGF